MLSYTYTVLCCIIDNSSIEAMGLLEQQAMPSVHDVAHGGVLCTFWGKWCGLTGQAAWTVNQVQNLTLLGVISSPASQRAKVLAQPSSLWPH